MANKTKTKHASLQPVIILMSSLSQSNHETLQYVSKFILLWNVKIILKSLNGKDV